MPLNRDVSKKIDVQRVRRKIDALDDKILDLVAERRNLGLELGRLKTELKDGMNHEARVREILARIEANANKKGMQGKEVRELWKALIKYTIKEQVAKYEYY